MTFKLGDQLDHISDPKYALETYSSYVQNNKHRFPESVLDTMLHPDWNGGSNSKSPYYGNVKSIETKNIGTRESTLKVHLLKDDYVETPIQIDIEYRGLLELDIPNQDLISEQELTWRYDQFLFFDPYSILGRNEKMFTHQIEWIGRKVWSITASDISVNWSNF